MLFLGILFDLAVKLGVAVLALHAAGAFDPAALPSAALPAALAPPIAPPISSRASSSSSS